MKSELSVNVLKEYDEKEFLRDVAINLSSRKNTPNDILTCQFGEVTEVENEYLVLHGETEINYTCLIGVDRKEIYYEDVKKYNSATKSYYYEKQQKTRTVTDWSPYSGTARDSGSAAVGNCNYSEQDNYRNHYSFMEAYKYASDHKKWEGLEEKLEVNPEALSAAEELSKELCFKSVNLPGDRQKDKSYTGTVTVKRKTIAKMPEYKTTYTYNDQTYNARGFASGKINSTATYPSEYGKAEKQAKKSASYLKWLAIGLFPLGLILLIVFCVLGLGWGAVFYVACIVGSLVCAVMYFKVKKNKEAQINQDNKTAKKQALIAYLEKNRMAPLSDEEIYEIDHSVF